MFKMSTKVLREVYRLTGGSIPLVGCGVSEDVRGSWALSGRRPDPWPVVPQGISSGAEAYAKVRAGASLVELYTSMVYQGPAVIPRVKRELAALLEKASE